MSAGSGGWGDNLAKLYADTASARHAALDSYISMGLGS